STGALNFRGAFFIYDLRLTIYDLKQADANPRKKCGWRRDRKSKMKIAVVGCGAVGSYYGAKLCRAGQEVHFLLRSDFGVVQQKGVTIRSVEGDFHVQPRCARTPEEIGASDVVLIALTTTANGQFLKLLPPLVGPQTAVITL